MHHMRYFVVLLLFALAMILVQTPATLNAQTTLQVVTPQATLVSQGSAQNQSVPPTPVAIETSAPIGENTRQVLLIMGATIGIALLVGGGIYLRLWWLANRW